MTGEEIVLAVLIIVVVGLLYTCTKDMPKCRKRKTRKENYTSSMPDTAVAIEGHIQRSEELKDLAYAQDYDEVAQYMALESGVFESHAQYSAELNSMAAGPSRNIERDDANDLIPWMGLRKPDFQGVFADPRNKPRQEHSEFPDQMRRRNPYVIG
jgi:uncharacterized membrane-anchored protein YhcB (DUF1043 family)